MDDTYSIVNDTTLDVAVVTSDIPKTPRPIETIGMESGNN